MPSSTTSVACSSLSFAWPDGCTVFAALDVAFPPGRTGLIGRNGGGKSTLLRLIAGHLTPTSGTLATTGQIAFLPQDVTLRTTQTVADLLGIATRRAALRAIESGDPDPVHFAALADDWQVEARAAAALERFGLVQGLDDMFDRPVATLSGGEAVLTGVAGLLLTGAPISLLDEPSNNLDRRGRERLYGVVDDWPGLLIVASHDRELLERVDHIVELREGGARAFPGPLSSYLLAIEAEQRAAARKVRTAEGKVAREKRQFVETQTKLAKRKRFADKAFREKREPRVKMNEMKRKAQVSAAKYRETAQGRLDDARAFLTEAEELIRDDDRIRIDLPATAVPGGRDVLRLGPLAVRGPERIALVGPNGAGKTTLLHALAGVRPHPRVEVPAPFVPVRYLPQRLDIVDNDRSVFDNVRAAAPSATPHEVRARLARFLVRGDRVDQLAGSLSGGERLRVTLACLLLAEPPPQLLLLDEPTNSLDLASVGQLVSALHNYRGAMIVSSHDNQFLADIGVTRHWDVNSLQLPVEGRTPG